MKALRLHGFGTDVRVDDVPEPIPDEGDVLVNVRLTAVNPLDLWVAEGSVAGGSQPLPLVLGTEGVADYDGTRVIVSGFGIGVTRDGLLRERAAVPRKAISEVPAGIEDDQAATVSVVGVTAKRVLDVGGLKRDDIVGILGASGGVGVVALQLVKLLGARAIAVTSSDAKREALQALGADAVVVSPLASLAETFEREVGEPADLVLNPLAGDSIAPAARILAVGGRQVLFGRSAGDVARFSASELYRKSISIIGYGGLSDTPERKHEARAWVLERIREGSVRIPISHEFALADAKDALELVRTGGVIGKVVVRPG